ncbi:hypothetical protein [Bacteroides propionicifaciens]|jgi:hypothetical protein|uniref:hypothetical protein n=1 Tax=Bacteroides propionicifaciens TaxID=392838 RepID=UPI00039AD166|nr:hypothetical protein [Bacteroides propionicifaciens]
MKKVTNVVLAVCAVVLLYMCYSSIMGPINFEKEKAKREKAVVARLIDIREAQLEYRKQFNHYANEFDSLIDFIQNGYLHTVVKEGELTDVQREAGITETKAVAMINKAKKTGDWKEVEKNGLTNFRRDTINVPVLSSLFPKNFKADSIQYVPFTEGAKFELSAKVDTIQSGPARFFQAQTPYQVYLKGLDEQEINNMIYMRQQLDRYPGLRVGSMEEPITTGNWESL